MERTMVKISAEEDYVSLRTYSRKNGKSGQFILCRRELDELNNKGKILSADGYSYARLYLNKNEKGEEVLKIEIAWLNTSGNQLIGRLERLSLIYQDFLCCVEDSILSGGKTYRRLSLSEYHRPAIEFSSSRNLRKVAQRKGMRRKLGKFLENNFKWPNSVKIYVMDDDCAPYSFFFREERISGSGICGGIILHRQEDLKKAYYGMHT